MLGPGMLSWQQTEVSVEWREREREEFKKDKDGMSNRRRGK